MQATGHERTPTVWSGLNRTEGAVQDFFLSVAHTQRGPADLRAAGLGAGIDSSHRDMSSDASSNWGSSSDRATASGVAPGWKNAVRVSWRLSR